MRINLTPIVTDKLLSVSKRGDALVINGEAYDFSSLPEGATIPAGVIPCPLIFGPVDRLGGRIVLTILLPCRYDSSHERLHSPPIIDPPDGVIAFIGDGDVDEATEVSSTWTVDQREIITAEAKAEERQRSIKGEFELAIQRHIDEKPREKNFRDSLTLASYIADEDEPEWAAQARAFIKWRTAVWKYSYAELARVMAGEREQPTISDFIDELPPLVWP